LAKIWTKVCGLVFLAHPVYCAASREKNRQEAKKLG